MGFLDWIKRAPANEQGDTSRWQTLKVYLYRADGRYGPPRLAESAQEFAGMVRQLREHVDKNLEVRITNPADHLLFHATPKGIEWDGIGLKPILDEDRDRTMFEEVAKKIAKERRGPSWER
jgi:hypothetical protein